MLNSDDSMYSGVYRMGDYKLIWGYTGDSNDWYLVDGTWETGDASDTYYLYNINSKAFSYQT